MVSKTANIATKKLKSINTESDVYSALGIEVEADPSEWVGLPAFGQKENNSAFKVIVSFRNKEDLAKFADLLGAPQLKAEGKRDVKSIWYPPLGTGERGQNNLFIYADEDDPDVQALLEESNDE